MLFVISISLLMYIFLISDERVQALSMNYNKFDNNSLLITDWNNLPNDFLAKSGGTNGVMSGSLDMNLNRISNLGSATNGTDAISKNYIDGIVASASGGSVFTNWGRSDCPGLSIMLYNGFAFGPAYSDGGSGSNIQCIQLGGSGSYDFGGYPGKIFPLISHTVSNIVPPGINPGKFIRCAVCYKPGASCYLKYGLNSNTNPCDGVYTLAYQGYLMGAIAVLGAGGNDTSRKRVCVNSGFDNNAIVGTTPTSSGGLMAGSWVENNFGQTSYQTTPSKYFEKCAVCCN